MTKLVSFLKDSFYKIVWKSFIYLFPNKYKGYMVPKLTICTKIDNLVIEIQLIPI